MPVEQWYGTIGSPDWGLAYMWYFNATGDPAELISWFLGRGQPGRLHQRGSRRTAPAAGRRPTRPSASTSSSKRSAWPWRTSPTCRCGGAKPPPPSTTRSPSTTSVPTRCSRRGRPASSPRGEPTRSPTVLFFGSRVGAAGRHAAVAAGPVVHRLRAAAPHARRPGAQPARPRAATPEALAAIREKYRLDEPLPASVLPVAQRRAARPTSAPVIRSDEPVTTLLADRVVLTLQLALMSFVLTVLVGVPLGIAAAWRAGGCRRPRRRRRAPSSASALPPTRSAWCCSTCSACGWTSSPSTAAATAGSNAWWHLVAARRHAGDRHRRARVQAHAHRRAARAAAGLRGVRLQPRPAPAPDQARWCCATR